jgi:hypothetical protein
VEGVGGKAWAVLWEGSREPVEETEVISMGLEGARNEK